MENQFRAGLAAAAMRLKKPFSPKNLALILFSIYFVVGMCIVKDYGISIDENVERITSLHNYVYVFEKVMIQSDSEAVRNVAENFSGLMAYDDRFYGAALQGIPVFIEHLNNFEMLPRDIYILRHAFTFLNYFAGGVFFFLILRRRFGNTYIPVVGALFYILYPRFFGESFYNIKDILFYSWCIISSYFLLRWMENGKGKFCVAAAATLAVTINTRILGISLLLLACAFAVLMGIRQKAGFGAAVYLSLKLGAATFLCYAAITPFLWENPLKNTIDTFFHFVSFQPWVSSHLYLGKMISKAVPWHYIPVWMGVTVPILYMALFLLGSAIVCVCAVRFLIRAYRNRKTVTEKSPTHPNSQLHTYDLYFFALFFCTLLGYILLHISMYEGWRHAYSIFFPFLYLAVYGLEKALAVVRDRKRVLQRLFIGAVSICLCVQLGWIITNHPYQNVYFNVLGQQVAEKGFTLDYWEVSHADLIRYILAHDESSKIRINREGSFAPRHALILTEEENKRIVWTDLENASYYLRDTRVSYDERVPPEGFAELTSIIVDNLKISTLYKRE